MCLRLAYFQKNDSFLHLSHTWKETSAFRPHLASKLLWWELRHLLISQRKMLDTQKKILPTYKSSVAWRQQKRVLCRPVRTLTRYTSGTRQRKTVRIPLSAIFVISFRCNFYVLGRKNWTGKIPYKTFYALIELGRRGKVRMAFMMPILDECLQRTAAGRVRLDADDWKWLTLAVRHTRQKDRKSRELAPPRQPIAEREILNSPSLESKQSTSER